MVKCSFCKRPRNEVKNLISSSDTDETSICDRCVRSAMKELEVGSRKGGFEKPKEEPLKPPMEIKAHLDTYVIGQDQAKRTIATAVYNHFKRRQVAKDGKLEIEVHNPNEDPRTELVELEKSNILLLGPSGCHRAGQLVLMYDGTFKTVEDVEVGDQLMGPDSTPRTVLELHRGHSGMVEITPKKGVPWVVNAGHILTVETGTYSKSRRLVDVDVQTWSLWPKSRKLESKLVRVPVTFPRGAKLPLDPYLLGVLLGDGSLGPSVRFTSADSEIVRAMTQEAKKLGLRLTKHNKWVTKNGKRLKSKASCYILSGVKGVCNPISSKLKILGLWGARSGTKFVPYLYKVGSYEERMSMLAGLIDTDGSYNKTGKSYNYKSKSKALIDDVAFLVRSLGFATYPRAYKLKGVTYYSMEIVGDVSNIPVRVRRKKGVKRGNGRNVLRTGFVIRPLPPEDYFGFVLDGDHRYLLDDFTVTHNTGKTYLARTIAKMLNVPFFVADATRLTQAGYVGDDVETLLQGLLQDAQGDVERAQWGIIFLDEVDKIAKSGGRDRSGYRDVTGEGVQQSLLKLLEGSKVNVPRSGRSGTSMSATDVLDTTNILFICAGSFAGIEPIIEKRLNKGSRLGFGSESREKFDQTKTYLAACPEDLLEFGIIPEMLGRLQVLTTTIELSEEDMIRVLTEPRNSIIKQFRALFKLDGVSLEFDPEALLAIARKAKKMPTGARALRSIVEEALGQVMYSLPGSGAIQVRVTEQTIETGVAMVTKETQCKHHYADKSDPEENCTHCGQNQGLVGRG